MVLAEIVKKLTSFPEEYTREFEEAAVALATGAGSDIEQQLRELTTQPDRETAVRYAAFFTLSTSLRRRGHFSALVDLVENHASDFQQFGTFHHMKAMALAGRGEPHDLPLAIASCARARELLPQHPGVLHSYATLRIAELEAQIPMSEILVTNEDKAVAEDIDAILSQVLLERPRYAKFHASLARLESLRGNHRDAQKFLSRAMELEDPAAKDFNLRIVSYNQILSRIVMRESLSTVASETKNAMSEARAAQESVKTFVDQMQTRYLELLGIFAAIIGIVLSGIQVITTMDFTAGARLMLVVTGSILVLFSAVTAVLQRPVRYMFGLGGFGILLISAGFVSGLLA